MRIPVRYLPKNLTQKDKKQQIKMLAKSRKMYKHRKYYTRKQVASYKSKPSKHIKNAQRTYKIQKIVPSTELARATGCSINTLDKIVKKGEGAYFSSGSRPNQTAQSWGFARLASAITAGKAAAVDYNILEKGCNHKKKAFLLAKKAKRKYNYGKSHTPSVSVSESESV
jgi:DNA-binding Xre family transcriptional regulator